jgi:hypothetical protein
MFETLSISCDFTGLYRGTLNSQALNGIEGLDNLKFEREPVSEIVSRMGNFTPGSKICFFFWCQTPVRVSFFAHGLSSLSG